MLAGQFAGEKSGFCHDDSDTVETLRSRGVCSNRVSTHLLSPSEHAGQHRCATQMREQTCSLEDRSSGSRIEVLAGVGAIHRD